MLNSPPNHDDDFLLTFADLMRIIRKNTRKIWIGSGLFALLAFSYGLTRPVEYQAEATFKEKNKSQSGLNKSILTQLVGSGSDSDALTLMKSRRLYEQLIQNMGWQAAIVKKESYFPFLPWQTIKNNLLVEYALLKKLPQPILKDHAVDLKAELVSYRGEVPLNLRLQIDNEKQFSIFENQHELIGTGTFAKPFATSLFSFTLQRAHDNPIEGNEYYLSFLPLGPLAEGLAKQFQVEGDRTDKGLVKISFKHPSRHQAAAAVESLMAAYQNYIHTEHQRICCLQVDYLIQRQQEMGSQLADVMHKHAQSLSSDLSNTGFATSEKAIDFLADNQQQLKQKLLTIDLDLQRLEHMRQTNETDYDKFTSTNTPEAINRLTAEIRSLKQQADALNLALRNTPVNIKAFQDSFSAQMLELNDLKKTGQAASTMLANLDDDKLPQPATILLDNPKFIVNMWYARALACHQHLLTAKPKDLIDAHEEWKKCKEGFSAYLSHMIHYLYIYQRNIEERLAHQQSPLAEFQGINLNIAKDLYINYSKDLSETESHANQQSFIIGQIGDPAFEISSLSTVLTDPISTEMISKASAIILTLKDSENRSLKEQERLKSDLAIQKGFLTTHLQQAVQLLDLRQNFLKEKITSLQSINLSLLHEQISLLENQTKKYIANAIDNLKQEQKLLQDNLKELRLEMAAFPHKWAAERLIEQQMEINKTMVEEISKLVESKNISNNLEKIQSAPLDMPIIPIHPKSPRLFLLALIGAVLGAFLSTAYVLARSISTGLEASAESLRLAGYHVSGSLSRQANCRSDNDNILDADLDTLRRLIALTAASDNHESISAKQPLKKTLLLLKSRGPNYTHCLASLMSKMGLKVLSIDLSFDNLHPNTTSTILPFLEGQTAQPAIEHGPAYDTIAAGGFCRYAHELIGSRKFQTLLVDLSQQYDRIVISSKAPPPSAEAESLLDIFPNAAISLTGETLPQLHGCLQHARLAGSSISFIMTETLTQWDSKS